MKNIQIIDDAINATYDIFSVTDEDFDKIFVHNTDVLFIEDIDFNDEISSIFQKMWDQRIKKSEVNGIHGTIFYGLEDKKCFYPTLKDEEAINPDGSKLRR
jgi:hypothetical protein